MSAKEVRASALMAGNGYVAIRAINFLPHDPSRVGPVGYAIMALVGAAFAFASLRANSERESDGFEFMSAGIFAIGILTIFFVIVVDPGQFKGGYP